ncbi:pyridoxal phosphate-dependent aminotransferase [Bacillus licheniformis]|jgi:aminotransferase|uniref:Aminotransferase, class I and II n=5 Tax=Bacillales TaxID=1385 RepID=Q65KJ9_BACLD|nr:MULTISPECIES: pyridoxal phosphate-dependent aminotransferase [Bacillus]MBJ7885675.1 pyridoxal phosphate-dependent aminotransferase [Bacillaceae bacterium HSR45]MBY8346243.1 pyridoxal phosphate-dependent aminotransferase [Bacillus sp. PCH94]MDP4080491.1 pyridoxal phosphate-dependent aminotransferase [Bacillota bacterium]AAU23061.1 Aminotransferase, class I and II [Bacillus licheniformis DSM 13 = ATCC 14580]AAU40415.1 aromatic amino acid aminotransferase apoenzyme MtnE [Bacillus licheniformis
MKFEHSDVLKQLPEQFFASLVKKVNEKIAAGHDVINLGQGNPDQPTPEHIVDTMAQAVRNPENHRYSSFRGSRSLKEAAAAFYQREYGVELDPEREVAVLFGGKAGLVELPQCLLNPGDTVLVPDPGYPDYWSGVELARANMETMPLTADNQFLPDYSRIPKEVKEKAKLMYLNYPNNPTGAQATSAFFEETVRFAKSNGICVVHDFAYGAIGYDGKRPVSFLETAGAKDAGIEIYTLSKTYNMAGWRVGFAVGNASVIEALNLYQDHMYVSLFKAVQDAAAAALLSDQACVQEQNERYEKRRNAWIRAVRDIGWHADAPQGSFFAWMPVPDGYTSEAFSDLLLEKANVVTAPGIGFGKHGEGYVRVGLLTSEERLREAASRIAELNIFKKTGHSH